MFGDMSPLCNGPSVIYHPLPSLQRRLDWDEHKEYEDDLVWARDTSKIPFFFFSGRDNAIQLVRHSNMFWTPLCEFESAFLPYFLVRSKNQSLQAAVMWLSEITSHKSAPSSFCFSPKAENSSDSDLILIANLPHANIASVLRSPHDTVHDNCFVAQRDREPETKQLFSEDFLFSYILKLNPGLCKNKLFSPAGGRTGLGFTDNKQNKHEKMLKMWEITAEPRRMSFYIRDSFFPAF